MIHLMLKHYYQIYVFKLAFAVATERLKDKDDIELRGQQKMGLFAKLSRGFGTENTNSIINPYNNLSKEDIAKLRRNNAIIQRFDQFVNYILEHIQNNTEGNRDCFVNEIYSDLKSVLSQQSV